ncbi:MAG: hypothetical protein ACRELF_25725 [Gemmataceae bacterium]
MSVVVGVVTLREGSEIVRHVYGITDAAGTSAPAVLAGGALGLACGVVVGVPLY